MDIVFIEQLTVETIIGVYDWEQKVKQILVFDIEMQWDNRQAAHSDNVKDCLNYHQVGDAVVAYVTQGQFQLVERVAEEVAVLIIKQFRVAAVKIKVCKPSALPYAKQVGVIIQRVADASVTTA